MATESKLKVGEAKDDMMIEKIGVYLAQGD
jgi:hypothetical protein